MKFKEHQMEAQFYSRPTKLQEICHYFEALSLEHGIEPVVTRVLDRVPGESGVHPAGRAVDFRDEMRDGESSTRLYTAEQVEEIVQAINSRYPREDGKVVCLHHSFCGGAEHFHIQTPFAWNDYPR